MPATTRDDAHPARFLSALSHELRTPLGSILMLSEMIGAAAGETGERGRKIHGLALDLRALIDEVGELARLDSGRARIQVASVRTLDLAADIGRGLAAAAPEARPVTSRNAADLPTAVRADRARVLQIVEAVAASMAAEGPPIVARIEPVTAGRLAIRVIDTADAPPGDELEGLFRPFGEPSRRTSRAFGGQSLRLAIAHRVAHLLGGDLSARTDSEGLAFTLHLPVDGPQDG